MILMILFALVLEEFLFANLVLNLLITTFMPSLHCPNKRPVTAVARLRQAK